MRFGFGSGLLVFTLIACSSQQDDTPPPAEPIQSAPGCSRTTTLCEVGGPCEGAQDCKSNACRDGKCQAVNPPNGTQDNGETDVDCGGPASTACADGKNCVIAADCTSNVCTGGTCQAPSPTDGVKNGDETGVDCGGAKAPKCGEGQGCGSDADCNNLKCDPTTKKCLGPTHEDGIKNGDETGIDCGGPTATKKCAPGDGCAMDSDCDKVRCDVPNKKCLPPSATDGLQNGTETDIDCGGTAPTNAPKCAVNQKCSVHADCLSDGCSYTAKTCAVAPSCATHFGGDTCGKGEVGQAGSQHESCCATATLAGTTKKLDKYEITAGRMREFISRTGGNVRGWVDTNATKVSTEVTTYKDYLPEDNDNPVRSLIQCNADAPVPDPNNPPADGTSCTTNQVRFGVYGQLGNEVFQPDRPCPNCGQGCWLGSGTNEFGHPTYWWSDKDQSDQFGAAPRRFKQEELDVKSLNCVTQLLLAAFCAWDGGRLPTQAEMSANATTSAWGTATMPWGTTAFDTTLAGAPHQTQYYWTPDPKNYKTPAFFEPAIYNGTADPLTAAQYNVTNWNPFPNSPDAFNARYVWPVLADFKNDGAYAIAAPGRMYNDFHSAGAAAGDGFYDVAANMIEITGAYTPCTDNNQCAPPYSTCNGSICVDDANHNSLPAVPWVGGSFEGHPPIRAGYHRNILTKYGKMGGRCIHD